ncbi:ABC transporter substrate-binding protein [Pseudonocardia sp. RS010]|uniref:ABC transporter substrate-binding protein n=1 Tax=Pseudonocardia sp. RS010 TaxID=3385979 RepID=UPI0039A02F18
MLRFRSVVAAAMVAAASIALAGCGSDAATGDGGGDTVKVGMLVSFTGNFATQAKDFDNSFTAGLQTLTNGTMEVAGHKIEVIREDDTGDPAIGTTKAKDLIGQGVQILTGPTNSNVAIAAAQQAIQNKVLYVGGTSGTSELVGMDDLVFATSGASPAGNQLYKSLFGDPKGKRIAAIGQDYAYGQDQVAQLKSLVEPLGGEVVPYLLPQSTTDFGPLMLQLKQNPPDFVTSFWAGAGQDQLWNAIAAQRIPDESTVFTVLLLRSSWPATADALGPDLLAKSVFGLSYFPGMTGNDADKALQAYSAQHDHQLEYDDAVGWNAAAMVVRAVSEGGTDTAKMAAALKGWTFDGPSGPVSIRAEDNQVTVPMATVRLESDGTGGYTPQLIKLFDDKELTPPVVKPIAS